MNFFFCAERWWWVGGEAGRDRSERNEHGTARPFAVTTNDKTNDKTNFTGGIDFPRDAKERTNERTEKKGNSQVKIIMSRPSFFFIRGHHHLLTAHHPDTLPSSLLPPLLTSTAVPDEQVRTIQHRKGHANVRVHLR